MVRTIIVAAALLACGIAPAWAQYYPQGGYGQNGDQAPGGYSPDPDGYGPRGSEAYPPPRPEGELPPRAEGYGRPYGPPGGHCDAFVDTPYGPRHRVCPMGVAKPLGAPCACPPRGPYGRTAEGRVSP